jgi:hypothetical protein
MGVPEGDLRSTRFLRFNWQAGGAVTLPLPFAGAIVLAKSRFLVSDESGGLAVGRHLALIRHELVHSGQRREWGIVRYWLTHLLARVTTRSLLAAESGAERPAYEAEAAARGFLDQRGIS